MHEAIDDNEIIFEFPEEYLGDKDEIVFMMNGENIFMGSDSLDENGISFVGVENWEHDKWGISPEKYVHLIDENRETLETRQYKIDLNVYESEDIEISFHDGYGDYDKEIEAMNKSRLFSIISVTVSILLILFF